MAGSIDKCVRKAKAPTLTAGRHQAKIISLVDRATLEQRYSESENRYPTPMVEVVFLITAGGCKGNKVKWSVKLEDDENPNGVPFSDKQQERAQELMNELLENCDKERLSECLGAECIIKLAKMSGNNIIYFDGSSYLKKQNLDLESDREFLAGK